MSDIWDRVAATAWKRADSWDEKALPALWGFSEGLTEALLYWEAEASDPAVAEAIPLLFNLGREGDVPALLSQEMDTALCILCSVAAKWMGRLKHEDERYLLAVALARWVYLVGRRQA
jgi:hypothetical protein